MRKEYSVLEMYFIKGMKPRQIVSAIKMGASEVDKIVQKFKKDCRRVE